MALVARNITGTVKRADGEAIPNARIFIKPVRVFGDAGVIAPSGVFHVDADGNGEADFNLLTSDAENAFVRYEMTLPGSLPFRFDLVNGGPTTIDELYNLAAASGGSDMASLETLVNAAKRPYKAFVARMNIADGSGSVTKVFENEIDEDFESEFDVDNNVLHLRFPSINVAGFANRFAVFLPPATRASDGLSPLPMIFSIGEFDGNAISVGAAAGDSAQPFIEIRYYE